MRAAAAGVKHSSSGVEASTVFAGGAFGRGIDDDRRFETCHVDGLIGLERWPTGYKMYARLKQGLGRTPEVFGPAGIDYVKQG
jgi:hypothetical protein